MLKATKLTLPAVLLVGSCGLAMAQASGTGGAAEGKPDGPCKCADADKTKDAAPPEKAKDGG